VPSIPAPSRPVLVEMLSLALVSRMSRLRIVSTAPSRPQNVSTALQTLTPPKADTARYDRLRRLAEQEASHD